MGRDLNDVRQSDGLEAVAEAINDAQTPAPEPAAPTVAEIAEAAIAATLAGDAGALFEPDALAALCAQQATSPADWQRTRARVKKECDVSVRDLEKAMRAKDSGPDGDEDGDDDSPALAAVRLARSRGDFFRDGERVAYASVHGVQGQARETWRIDGQGFRDWLGALYYKEANSGLSDQAMQTAVNTLRAVALHDGEERPVGLRVAAVEGGALIDLGGPTWSAVLVTAAGWRVVESDCLPVRLYRTNGMQALPMPLPAPAPVHGGAIDRLWQHANVQAADRLLVLAWLLDALRPGTTYPVLELCGPQGAAKSSTQRRLRALIDPHAVPLRGRPKCVEDIYIAAGAGYMLSYENVSGLPPDMQDALCVLATGGGFASRRLYTNAEESVIQAHRPVVMNGISANATRPDLIDRLIHVAMPEIGDRLTDAEADAAWATDAAAIFGAVLDLFSATLAALPGVEIARNVRPRLAGFTLLGEAMVRALGEPAGVFLKLFTEHRAENMTRALDASPLAQAVVALIEAGQEIVGETAKHAYERLAGFRPQHSDERFPQSPKAMMDGLRRYAPALRLLDIHVTEHGRTMHGYALSIRRHARAHGEEDLAKSRSSSSSSSYPQRRQGLTHEHGAADVHADVHGHERGDGPHERGMNVGDPADGPETRAVAGSHELHELHERENATSGFPRARTHAPDADVQAPAREEGEL